MLLGGCSIGVLAPRGVVGASEKQILLDSLAIMLAIVLPTIAATLGFAWWFRADNKRAKYMPEWTYSGRIEMIVWGIPLLTIMLLGGVTWISAHQLDPAVPLESPNQPLQVQVVSLDWKWLFIYPDHHVASVNDLTIPVGTPVNFTLTSASVMNTFFVPQLGSQIYTMPGMASRLNLLGDHTGTFAGLSAHYSGDGFSDMYFAAHVVSADDFAQWIATTRGAGGPVLDTAAYHKLERQSTKVAPFTYSDLEPDLFQKIVVQDIPPAPGPQTGYPAVDVSNRTEQQ